MMVHAEPEAVLWHMQQVGLVPGSFSALEVGSLIAWQQQIQTTTLLALECPQKHSDQMCKRDHIRIFQHSSHYLHN